MSEPWRRPVSALAVTLVAAALAMLAMLLAGCTDSTPEPTAEPSSPSTPLASYDTREVAVARAPYCDRVSESAIEEALGEAARKSSTYNNGDPVRVADGVTDIAHEYGCAWSAGSTRARTWLFAPPVTGDRARDLLEQARAEQGCVPDEQAPAFGMPSVALVCADGRDVAASYRGLFGDAWLVCELTGRGDRAELAARADRWCVQVVEAARAG